MDIFIFLELAVVEAGLFPRRFAELDCEALGWDCEAGMLPLALRGVDRADVDAAGGSEAARFIACVGVTARASVITFGVGVGIRLLKPERSRLLVGVLLRNGGEG